MQKRKFKKWVVMTAAAAALNLGFGAASAQDLDEIFAIIAEGNRLAQASQTEIDGLSEETDRLLQEYKTIMKEVEGLRVYNTQVQRQIDSQNQEITELRGSIERVTLIERQITPLMIRMIDALDEFVANDVPFLMEERTERLELLRDIMDEANVSPSEKFRVVFEAYQIENGYGRTIEAYEDTLTINGGERRVNILRIGRVVLAYQTTDGNLQGVWDKETQQWVALGDEYRGAINEGIRIASNQTAPNLIRLPVKGPEDVQ